METVYILQHVWCEPPARIEAALRAAGVRPRLIRVYAGDPVPPEMGEGAGLVVMGGPMGVYEHEAHPFLREELRLIEDALSLGRPVLGTCLGSQLLAAALGASVRPGGRKEIGWHEVRLTDEARTDALLAGLPPSFTALHWHGDVFDLPAGSVRLASSDLTENQAFRYGSNAYGFLFHMEITEAILRDWVSEFGGEMEEAGVAEDAVLGPAPDHLDRLGPLGDTVYRRWAGLLRPSPR
ncbi:MAG: amidotransferase [Deltaproteobacteria bacterium]|nr:amidotransferase [Deltaproteobacteria bacterium]